MPEESANTGNTAMVIGLSTDFGPTVRVTGATSCDRGRLLGLTRHPVFADGVRKCPHGMTVTGCTIIKSSEPHKRQRVMER